MNGTRKRTVQALVPAGGLALAGLLAITAGTASAGSSSDEHAALPDTLQLDAVIRDFHASHPDFQAFTGTTTVGLVQEELGEDGLPVMKSLRGFRVRSDYKDSSGRAINPALFDPQRGDVAGVLEPGPNSNGLASEDSFNQWYRDIPGVNASTVIGLEFNRVPGTNRYVFDSARDEPWVSLGGFFPIDGELFGSHHTGSGGLHNFHFTTQINTEFVYTRDAGQIFKFSGDDDVWVYIDGKLVIDIGGLHPRRQQFLELDRLDWLQSGRTYTLDIFHAERRTTQSNFRVETTIQLRQVELPPTTAIYD